MIEIWDKQSYEDSVAASLLKFGELAEVMGGKKSRRIR